MAPDYRRDDEKDLQTPKHRRPEPDNPNEVSGEDYQSNQARDDSNLQQLLQGLQAVKDGAVNEIEKQQILREGRDYLANAKKRRWALRTGKVGN